MAIGKIKSMKTSQSARQHEISHRPVKSTVYLTLISVVFIVQTFTSADELNCRGNPSSSPADGALHDATVIVGVVATNGKSGRYSDRCVVKQDNSLLTEK